MSEAIEKFVEELDRSLTNDAFVKLSLGNYRGAVEQLQKVVVRPLDTKKGRRLLFQYRYNTRDISKTFEEAAALLEMRSLISSGFRSGHLFSTSGDYQLTIGKKSARLVTGKPTYVAPADRSHDRKKRTIVDANAPYLKALGIATDDGKIRSPQQDKWRQINKYVETLRHLFETSMLSDRSQLTIIDMGSGKGYLTFAAYDYFSNVRGLKVAMTGVEGRKDLVDLCNEVAIAAGFDGLNFVSGSIDEFDVGDVDMLIALHACDTATDDAIYKGIVAKAALIVAAPCCHKEVRPRIRSPKILSGILKHGTMLERTAEMLTDGIRALLLEDHGYSTKVFEFVETEHTPKNNMIVGTLRDEAPKPSTVDSLMGEFGVTSHRLYDLLKTRPPVVRRPGS